MHIMGLRGHAYEVVMIAFMPTNIDFSVSVYLGQKEAILTRFFFCVNIEFQIDSFIWSIY